MNDAAFGLSDLVQPRRSAYRIRQVVAVNGDDTVDLAWGTDENGDPVTVPGVPCESGYPSRNVGDIVKVEVDPHTGWSVVSKLPLPAAPPFQP